MYVRSSPLRVVYAAVLLAAVAHAQVPTQPSFEVAFGWDSGPVKSASTELEVVAATTVRVQGASWLQLHFSLVALDGDPIGASRAIVRVTSHLDGATQQLDATAARQWRNGTAYFNGDKVELELLAARSQQTSRLILRSVTAGHLGVPSFSQCGATDDRYLSSDARSGRTMPAWCTGWLFSDCMHCLLTAGHCAGLNPVSNLLAIEFNVPRSTATGAIQHPPPEDQYAIDPASFQWVSGSFGNEFCYFGCFPNSNTGLTPFQTQQDEYVLASSPPAFDPSYKMRVTGFGTDATPLTSNGVQQTATGDYVSFNGTTIRYAVDTESGSSGAPVQWDNGGGVVIGIHTSSGCLATIPSNGNYGTPVNNAGLQAALATPLGVCDPTGTVSNFCTAKVNSQGCTPVLASVGTPSQSAGPGSFTISASQLINQKTALLYYGYAPLGQTFKGGFKCVAQPTHRTHWQSSGGSPTGADCTGAISYDMGARIASGIDSNLVCGTIVYAQVWSRDPADPYTTNLTEGLRFVIGS